jgi:hypothetical protein
MLPQRRRYLMWRRRLIWSAALLSTSIVVIASIDSIWGAPWPTEPVFAPESPAPRSPLEIPFTVTNESLIFPIRELGLTCHLIFSKSLLERSVANAKAVIPAGNLIRPRQSRQYACVFNDRPGMDPNATVRIGIEIKFESRSPFGGTVVAESSEYTWKSTVKIPHWVVGIQVQ